MFRPRSTSAGGWAGAEVTEKLILFTDKIIQDFIYRTWKRQDWAGIEKNPQSQQPRNMVFFMPIHLRNFHLEYLSSIDSEKYEVDVGNRLL